MDHSLESPPSPPPRGTDTPADPAAIAAGKRSALLDNAVRGAAAAGLGLLLGAGVLLVDAMGGVVGMPGKAVRYVFLTAAVVAWAVAAGSGRWVERSRNAGRVYGTAAASTGLLFALCAYIPSPVAMSVAACAAGIPAGIAVRARWCMAGGAKAVSVVTGGALWLGVAAAGVICGRLAFHPEAALAVCGAGMLLLHVPAVAVSRRTDAPGSAPALTEPEHGRGDATGVVLGAAAFAATGSVVTFLDLQLFQWSVLGGGQADRLAVGAAFAAVIVVGGIRLRRRRGARPERPGGPTPFLLLAAAAGPVATATAGGSRTAVLGLAAAAGFATLAATAAAAGSGPLVRPRAVPVLSMVFAGSLTAIAWRWGAGQLVSREDATVLLAIPLGAVALGISLRSGRRRRLADRRALPVASAAAVVAALLFAIGAVPSAGDRAHAAQTASIEVTASTGLVPGQKITVTGRGFQPGLRAVAVGQCSEGYTGPQHCDLKAGATFVNVDADGRLPKVVLTMVTSVHGVDCMTRQCVIGVGPLPGTNPKPLVDANTVNLRIGFAGGSVAGDQQPNAQTAPAPAGTGGSSDDGPTTALWAGTMAFLVICLAAAIRRRDAFEADAVPEDPSPAA
ncbi:neocarzinostatin apoprotein domain-containing protein [Yinghuangia soli]|uniref:Uncharacterized protein n=1 Tax=Yinghuangia soli TaxID=2908204 RepID=A0AA41Q5D5_9ACTN|nr:neocarzinostatin apoprotein domain-containing protein [Yinghuangia soli]MCF2531532.1 hypothetical protein [Yinghuangia soli]